MSPVTEPSSISPTTQKVRCHYLGHLNDPTTCCSYPSRGNHCFAVNPPRRVQLPYQESVCLNSRYSTCQFSQADWSGTHLEASIFARPKPASRLSIPLIWLLAVVLLFLLVISYAAVMLAPSIL